MTGESYLSTALIPLLMTVVLIYYSFRLLFLQDVDSIYGKNKKKPKDKEGFAKAAGKLMVFLAAASLGMAVIMYWSVEIALVEICIAFVIFGILWKKMNKNTGNDNDKK
ncbi:MAG: hypothetical protein ACLR6B_07760 [Blautia sp.]